MTPLAGLTVTRRNSVLTVLICGQRDITWCRGRIPQHGYQLTATATLNYNAITTSDISAVEHALLGAIADIVGHAAGPREANQPLCDLAAPTPDHQEGPSA